MDYDGLQRTYWEEQAQRIEQLRQKIVTRSEVTPGHTIPDDTDLAIGSGRYLQATILFIDISGFSRRQSATGAEQELMLRVLNLFFTQMIRIIEDYGGAVEKNTGDGLMAYFEDSILGLGDGNSVKRALACALTMDAANEHLVSPILRETGVSPLQFRTTMDYGPITIARIGLPQRFNANVAIGNAANFASHMLALVNPGDVALGSSAYDRLPTLWKTTWAELSPIKTNWTYLNSTTPYPLYLYKARWSRLT